MKRRSDEEWRELFAEQAASGKTAEVFCRVRSLGAKYFSKRCRRLLAKREELSVRSKRSAFVAVSTPTQADCGLTRAPKPTSPSA